MINEISQLYRAISTYLEEDEKTKLIVKAIDFANDVTARIYYDEDINLEAGLLANVSCKKNVSDFIFTFITAIQTELQVRFINEFKTNEKFYKGLQILDPSSIQEIQLDENSLSVLCRHADLNSVVTFEEFMVFKEMFSNLVCNDEQYREFDCDKKMNTLIKFLCEQYNEGEFENIYHLYKFMFTIPCTEVKCERDFSHMKNVKSYKRSVLSDINHENEMLIILNKDLLLDLDFEIILKTISQRSNKMGCLLAY